MEGRICSSGLARQVSVLGAVRNEAKDLTQLGEEQRLRTGKKPGKSAPVGRELSSKERQRQGKTQQVPLEGTSVIKTRSQHLQEYLHPAV